MQPDSNNHVFHKGIKDNLDISKLKNDTWAFPTLNVRLMNKGGQGYVVTNLKGNTVNDGSGGIGGEDNVGAVLKVKSNYIIIAAREFNGILYIASADNDGSGQGELGVYPAPLSMLDPTVTGQSGLTGFPISTNTYPYGRYYAALGNFNPVSLYTAWNISTNYVVTDKVTYLNHTYECIASTVGVFNPAKWKLISSFNSTAFNFTFQNMLEIEIRPFYDNSVNLYLVDYTNPNRVINSGFDMITGVLTSTVYDSTAFYSTLNQILGTNKLLTINEASIIPSGVHKYGNYFFYLRYVNASLDKTDVITASNACQIYAGSVATDYTIEGSSGLSTNLSNKV